MQIAIANHHDAYMLLFQRDPIPHRRAPVYLFLSHEKPLSEPSHCDCCHGSSQ